jgi:uncharacterized protein YndB with AHSA1/START domain
MDKDIGISEDKMKFKLELAINKPRTEVWKIFTNPENLSKWQPSLTKVESVSGTPGQPGAVSNLTYEEGGREFSLMEKVIRRNDPNRFDVIYENKFTDNPVNNTFIEQGENETLWVVEAEFQFKTVPMKVLGPLLKKKFVTRTQKDMERFKDLMEKPQEV